MASRIEVKFLDRQENVRQSYGSGMGHLESVRLAGEGGTS
jgi:hypothetical protein